MGDKLTRIVFDSRKLLTFGIPILCCQVDRLDESLTSERCSESEKHAAESTLTYITFGLCLRSHLAKGVQKKSQ